MNMALNIRKQNLIRISIELIALFAVLLGVFTPKLSENAGVIYPRLQLSWIMITIAILFILFFQKHLRFPDVKKVGLGLVFPLFLLVISLTDSSLSLSLIGNSERNLGVITYLACFLFFFVGLILKLNSQFAIVRILATTLILELIKLFMDFIVNKNSAKGGSFYNINGESFFFSIMLIFLSIYLIEKLRTRLSLVIVVPLITLFDMLILNWIGSLQGIVGFSLSAILYFIYRLIPNSRNYANLVTITLFGFLAAFLSFVSFKSLPSAKEVDTNSFYERLEIYKTALFGIQQNIFFGSGVDRFNEVYFRFNLTENLKLVDNAHSVPLQLLATIGLFGLMAWSVLFVAAVRTPIQSKTPIDKALYFAVLAYLITGMFGIQVPGIEFVLYLILGGVIAREPLGKPRKLSKAARITPVGMLILVLAVSLNQFSAYLSQVNSLNEISRSESDFDKGKPNFYNKLIGMNDLGILLEAGRLSMFAQDKELGLRVMGRMINLNSRDQRTIALTLELANEWRDSDLLKIGNELRVSARGY